MQTALINRIRGIILAILVLCLMAALPALAVETPVTAQIAISPEEMSVPGTVDVSISVTNISGADLTQPVTLYDPNGKIVSGFGQNGSATLKAGAQMSVSLQGTVTQEMLDQGSMTYTLRWLDSAGQELALPITAEVHFSGERAGLRVVRTITPEVVRSGQSVKVSYELTNIGGVSISNIQVREKLSRTPKTLKNLAIGASTTVEFTAKMGNADLASSAEITYRPAGSGKSETVVIEEQTIPVAVKGLNVELSLDRDAVDIGETVRLVMTARNEGNITYSNVSAVDKKLGTVFENVTIPAFSTVTEEKELTITEPSSFQLKLTLPDNTGATNTMDTNAVSVSAYDPEKELLLTLLLTSDKESIVSENEDVTMTLVITNISNVDCKNVEITHNSRPIYTIPSLAAGQSYELKRDYTVSQAGSFCFTATAKDTIGNTVQFESNTLTLPYTRVTAAPTATPAPTVPPLETLPPAEYENTGSILRTVRNVLYTASNILGPLAAAALLLFIISSIVRAVKHHQSKGAYDHLDLAERRDYAQPAENSETGDAPKPAEKPAEAEADEQPAEQDQKQSEVGGFRMTRDRQTDEFPAWHEPAAPAAADAAETPVQTEGTPAEPEQPAVQDQPVVQEQAEAVPEGEESGRHSRTSLPDRRRRSRRS